MTARELKSICTPLKMDSEPIYTQRWNEVRKWDNGERIGNTGWVIGGDKCHREIGVRSRSLPFQDCWFVDSLAIFWSGLWLVSLRVPEENWRTWTANYGDLKRFGKFCHLTGAHFWYLDSSTDTYQLIYFAPLFVVIRFIQQNTACGPNFSDCCPTSLNSRLKSSMYQQEESEERSIQLSYRWRNSRHVSALTSVFKRKLLWADVHFITLKRFELLDHRDEQLVSTRCHGLQSESVAYLSTRYI